MSDPATGTSAIDAYRGVFVPILSPIDIDGRLHDPDNYARYIDWLIDRGVAGLFVCGSTGELTRLIPSARRDVICATRDAVDRRVPIVAGVACPNVADTAKVADATRELGVDAVALTPPTYFNVSSDGVEAYFDAIATATSTPIVLYQIPAFASELTSDVVASLAARHAHIIGIKDSTGDVPAMMRTMAAVKAVRDDFFFHTGWDPVLASMVGIGVDGGTNASAGVIPEFSVAMYQAARRGDVTRAARMQAALVPAMDAMLSLAEFPQGFRVGASTRGWDIGATQTPLSQRQLERAKAVRSTLEPIVHSLVELASESTD